MKEETQQGEDGIQIDKPDEVTYNGKLCCTSK